jgi:hypothetical protein
MSSKMTALCARPERANTINAEVARTISAVTITPMQPDRAGFSHLNGTRPRTSKLEAMNFLGLYYALNG